MLERYKNNESHFGTRGLVVLTVVFILFLLSILVVEPNETSDLGEPRMLFFGFIALPLLFILAVLDLIILALLKAFTWSKFFINFGFFTAIILLIFLIVH